MTSINLAPLLEASLPIRLHVATIVPAFLIGTWLIFASRKGSAPHRALGAAFLALMVLTSVSAAFIRSAVMPMVSLGSLSFGPIHLLVPYTLLGIAGAIRAVRRGEFRAHGAAVRRLYFLAILLAGAFTFMPGRVMHRMFLGG